MPSYMTSSYTNVLPIDSVLSSQHCLVSRDQKQSESYLDLHSGTERFG